MPDLQIFGFCFLFFTSYLSGPVRAYGAGVRFEVRGGVGFVYLCFSEAPLSVTGRLRTL